MSPSAPPPAPVQQPAPEAAKVDGEASVDYAEAKIGLVPAGVFPDLTSTPARRDPFTPIAVMGAETLDVQQQVAPRPAPTRVVSNPSGRVPRIQANPFNPFSQLNATANTQQVRIQEQDPEFELTGVIRGDRNVAIIRCGEGGRYVVKQGQLIDGRYKVESVSDDGATLVYKNRRIHVKLGGVKNAS
jgi:type IV pilus biogenesis protein PilP